MLQEMEFWVGISAILGWIWFITSFGKFIVYIIEYFTEKNKFGSL